MHIEYKQVGRVVHIAVDRKPWGVAEMTGEPFEWEFRQQTPQGPELVCITRFLGSVQDMLNSEIPKLVPASRVRHRTSRQARHKEVRYPVTLTRCESAQRKEAAVTAKKVNGINVIGTEVVYRSAHEKGGLANTPHTKVVQLNLADGTHVFGCTDPDCDSWADTVVGVTMHFRKHDREKAAAAMEPQETPVLQIAPVEEPPVLLGPEPAEEVTVAPSEEGAEKKVMDMTVAELVEFVEKNQQAVSVLEEWRRRALEAEEKIEQLRQIFR